MTQSPSRRIEMVLCFVTKRIFSGTNREIVQTTSLWMGRRDRWAATRSDYRSFARKSRERYRIWELPHSFWKKWCEVSTVHRMPPCD